MDATVFTTYREYLDQTGGNVAAAASLALADVMQRTLDAGPRPSAEPPAERPMTVPEVARLLRVTADKVLRWIHGGELPATNVATRPTGRGRYRVSHAGLAAFEQHRASLTTQSIAPRRITRRLVHPFPKTRHPTT
jgi:excisionase family DNA binding protein